MSATETCDWCGKESAYTIPVFYPEGNVCKRCLDSSNTDEQSA